MKALAVVVGLLALVGVAIAAFFAWGNSEYTACFAAFDSRGAADRAASEMRDAEHVADVEPTGPKERRPTSEGGRRIAVTFSDGETGEDAAGFRRAFHEVLRRETGVLGHASGECLEKTPID